ncbi:hypothetical protein RGR602_PC01820 (plasmid) [Rhizobium gallicum bv. gallicum R602sp]|uniref:Uncharacterized protein n=1 Tax=Rhizobium gallicum bv. gallicum R602sp TaxID=1041138 RepID=A0A0B4XCV3_9HYPH|nr:hypothetical protein RGR602_PC01820 [Rhizobium gallicum bv. gallicum R602sp]
MVSLWFCRCGFRIMPVQRHWNEELISSNESVAPELLCGSVVGAVFANGVKSLQEGAESIVGV